MTTFRVHFADGARLDVPADTPKDATSQAQSQHSGIVSKVKVVRASK